ncbi:hypothetical protein K7H94_14450 [Pantoea dispersa]|uniref:hypothetical protein n=1 Tax=Pantoea dispersa TaxID=59814 RepID=UPI001CA77C07|nr:hypothetical protein [Pantoea dispersa]QZY89609.1 hypothetical protein K7H94_14450 [Pantoea dispersa]
MRTLQKRAEADGISALSRRTNRSGAIHRAFHFQHRGECAKNRAATTRAVISGITWKEYLRDTSRHHDSLRMGYLHYPVAQTVAARFIAHFMSRTMAECAINCAATTRAVISGITWQEYPLPVRLSATSYERDICVTRRAIMIHCGCDICIIPSHKP